MNISGATDLADHASTSRFDHARSRDGHLSVSSTTLHVDATAAIDLLLASTEPAVGYLARRDVLNEPIEPGPEAVLSLSLIHI